MRRIRLQQVRRAVGQRSLGLVRARLVPGPPLRVPLGRALCIPAAGPRAGGALTRRAPAAGPPPPRAPGCRAAGRRGQGEQAAGGEGRGEWGAQSRQQQAPAWWQGAAPALQPPASRAPPRARRSRAPRPWRASPPGGGRAGSTAWACSGAGAGSGSPRVRQVQGRRPAPPAAAGLQPAQAGPGRLTTNSFSTGWCSRTRLTRSFITGRSSTCGRCQGGGGGSGGTGGGGMVAAGCARSAGQLTGQGLATGLAAEPPAQAPPTPVHLPSPTGSAHPPSLAPW